MAAPRYSSAATGPAGAPQRSSMIGTAAESLERGQECVFRFPGMSENTKEVWIFGQPADIVEATMEGVKVRMPEGSVTFRNEGDEVPRNACASASSIVKKAQEIPQATQQPEGETVEVELQEGRQLHKEVPKDSWYVTLEDLQELRTLVKRAVREGLIKPKDGDFDPNDNKQGPNIYTVNEQFIKKITRAKGGMNWALMKHRRGKKCDLFVTHSWEEGIYEFLDKVIHSWPKEATSAYCCMLANPQNLDIGSLISKPSESPFAKALMSAAKMMVVPNTRNSIYTRLWCAYEAYTAYKADKFIFTARKPPSFTKFLATSLMVAVLFCHGFFEAWSAGKGAAESLWRSVLFAVLLLLLSHAVPGREKYVCWCLGASDSFHVVMSPAHGGLAKELCGILLVYFVALAFLQIHAINAKRASEELKNRYRGSIRYASCSRPGDELAIRREIEEGDLQVQAGGTEACEEGQATKDVDQAIQVLMNVGMSTSSLRQALDGTVHIQGALNIDWFQTVICLTWTNIFLPYNMFSTKYLLFQACDLLLAAALVCWLLRMDLDKRALSASYLQKLNFGVIFIWLVSYTVGEILIHVVDSMLLFSCITFAPVLSAKLLSAILMSMDLHRIAAVLGQDFAQFLVTRGSGMPRFLAGVAVKLCRACLWAPARCWRRPQQQQPLREVEIGPREAHAQSFSPSLDVTSSSSPKTEDDSASVAAWEDLIASIKVDQ